MARFNININDNDNDDNNDSNTTEEETVSTPKTPTTDNEQTSKETPTRTPAMQRFAEKMEKQYQQKHQIKEEKPNFDDDFLNFNNLNKNTQEDNETATDDFFDDFFDDEQDDYTLSYDEGYTDLPTPKKVESPTVKEEEQAPLNVTKEEPTTPEKDFFDDFFDDEGDEEYVPEGDTEAVVNHPKEEEYTPQESATGDIIVDVIEPEINLREGGAIDIKPPDYKEPTGGGINTDDENQSGFNNIPAYNITVGRDGRETGNSSFGGDRKEYEPETVEKEKVEHVADPEGKNRWTVKTSSGKIDQQGLQIFRNINRARIGEENEEVLKNVMGAFGNETAKEKKLINRLLYGNEQIKAGSHKRFTSKDRDVLRFLAMFKYANVNHLARIHQVKPDSMYRRLLLLKERGLVQNKDLYGALPLWFLTTGGHICAGMSMPKITEAGITYTMLPHQFVVNHVAGNLWGGGVNVLALEDFPSKNHLKENGEYTWGETVVSEYEIQSSFASIRSMNSKAEIYRPVITNTMNREFNDWVKEGGPSPEMRIGNEYMWTLFPPFALKLSYHVPDLVVKRQRGEDGKPQSIAVEVELANKPITSYERTLRAYKYDTMIYSKVIWVVKSRGAARKLQELAQQLGMWKEGRVGIVPIYTEEGVFKGKSEWMI